MQKSLETRIKQCKEVIIQNIEKTIQNQMLYKYMKDEKLENQLKIFPKVNNHDGLVKMEFNDPQKALQYYEKANFRDKILVRPFNIYFNLQLSQSEMKKYYFKGVSLDNIRRLFEIARKVGICKINTNFQGNSSSKLKPNGILSFIRQEPIPLEVENKLRNELKEVGIELEAFEANKGLKSSIIVSNFYEGNLDATEDQIKEKVKLEIESKFKKILNNNVQGMNIAPIVKRKELPDPESEKGTKTVTKVRALVEFSNSDETIKIFEDIRKGYIQEKGRAILNFHNFQNNSYVSLIALGLVKPNQEMSDKQFQDLLVDRLRKVNENVVQVTVHPIKFNNTFVGRVYLKDEQSGKEFVSEYATKRQFLVEYFKDGKILFDINVDDKTQKKIRLMQKRVIEIQRNIKNENDAIRKARKPINNQPLEGRQMGFPPGSGGIQVPVGMPMNGMPVNPQMMQGNPMNAQMRVMGHPGQFPHSQNPQGPQNPNPQMGVAPKEMDMKMKINKCIQDKQIIVKDAIKNEKAVKTILVGPVKYTLAEILKISPNQIGVQSDMILRKSSVREVLEFLERPAANYDALLNRQA